MEWWIAGKFNTIRVFSPVQLFAESLNQLISRDELQKKVWEDNGVIVGRSLDTFSSKLRKKLSVDERLKIVNIHGKGYKLTLSE